jgi:hypothetical protein
LSVEKRLRTFLAGAGMAATARRDPWLGREAGVTLAGARLELPAAWKPGYLMTLYAFDRIRKLISPATRKNHR